MDGECEGVTRDDYVTYVADKVRDEIGDIVSSISKDSQASGGDWMDIGVGKVRLIKDDMA